MTFDARAIEAEAGDLEPFEFTGLDGQKYQLPNFLTLTERQVSAIQAGDYSDLEELAPEATDAMRDLPLLISRKLGEKWAEASGEAGKSPSGSRATRRAAQRSKRT